MMSIYSRVCQIYTPSHPVHRHYPCITVHPPSLLEFVLGGQDRAILEMHISKKCNWFLKMHPTHRSFSTLSTNNPSDLFAIFHHASKRSMMWSHYRDISKHVQSLKLIYCIFFFHIGHLDFNRFDGYLNCSIDFKNILNHLIPWVIDYTEAGTTPIAKIGTPRGNTSDFYISLQRLLQASSRIIYM